MANKKKQHYVPKLYMKSFANKDNKFAVFNIDKRTTYYPVPYEDHCYENYFYGKDQKTENLLSQKESDWRKVLDKTKSKKPLTKNDIELIKEFAVYQKQRTLAETEYGKQERVQMYIERGKSICAHKGIIFDDKIKNVCIEKATEHLPTPSDTLTLVDTILPLISDLKLLVIHYDTQSSLISSDVPIININPFCPFQIGFGCMGLIILFPISPQLLLVLYDSKMYPKYSNTQYITLYNEREVHHLNTLQLISAEKILFSFNNLEFSKFKANDFHLRNQNRSSDVINTLGTQEQKLICTSMRKTFYRCDFSFGNVRPDFSLIPLKCREAAPRTYDKEWEKKLRTVGDLFHQLSKADPKISHLIGMTGKEYHKWRDTLLKCCLKYWKETL